MFRKLRVALLAAALAISSLGTFGAGQAFAAYYVTCTNDNNNEHEYLAIDTTGVTAGYAQVTLRFTHSCTGSNVGSSMVFPISLQGPVCGAQLGWGTIGSGATNYWLYSHTDNCVVSNDTGWPAPVSGHRYELEIAANTGGCSGWLYSMADLTTGSTTYTKCGTRNASSVTTMWSGFESYDSGDQLGGPGLAIIIDHIKYAKSGTWYYFGNTLVHKNVGTPSGWTKSYWHTTASLDGSGHSLIQSYTSSH